MSRERTILVLSRDAQRSARWQSLLTEAGLRSLSPATFNAPLAQEEISVEEIDVVLTDDLRAMHEAPLPAQRLERGEIGIVAVGSDGQADVLLPGDVTPRELLLACRLLAQVVSLRRQLGHEQRQQRLLRQAAATDSLTGLANRRAWEEMLHRLTHHAAKPDQNKTGASLLAPFKACVLALLDIDGFKRWNEEFGHVLADQQLISVAERLTAALRPGDFAFRWGGDEFALLLANVDRQHAAAVVEQIRQAAGLQAPKSLTLSAGWSTWSAEDAISPAAAFREADERLRRAKSAGGDCTGPEN